MSNISLIPQTVLLFCIYTTKSNLWRRKDSKFKLVIDGLPELGMGCLFLDVSIPAPIKFMIFSIC